MFYERSMHFTCIKTPPPSWPVASASGKRRTLHLQCGRIWLTIEHNDLAEFSSLSSLLREQIVQSISVKLFINRRVQRVTRGWTALNRTRSTTRRCQHSCPLEPQIRTVQLDDDDEFLANGLKMWEDSLLTWSMNPSKRDCKNSILGASNFTFSC